MVGSGLGGFGAMVVFAALSPRASPSPSGTRFGMTVARPGPRRCSRSAALDLVRDRLRHQAYGAGRDLWSRVGGFHRVLSTPSSQERFDFSGREELYTAYVPWAVAFGCADEWAAKYRTEMGTEPPAPSLLRPRVRRRVAGQLRRPMVDDFSSTVDSAISSYEATQKRSSSGGGGGFSGGGGGGGGGGGSW